LSFLFTGITFAETIKIGVVDYPPHINFIKNIENDKAYRYVDSVLKGIYSEVEFIRLTPDDGIAEIEKGSIDLLFPLTLINQKFRHLTKPLFRMVPGLCFKKENFIPILSATHRLKNLSIGVLPGTPVLTIVKDAGANLTVLAKTDSLSQGIDMLITEQYKAFYHPNPMEVYHDKNPLSKILACSKFLGYPSGVYIAVKEDMDEKTYQSIDRAFSRALEINSYEQYFWKSD
jgi:hypothetical protein